MTDFIYSKFLKVIIYGLQVLMLIILIGIIAPLHAGVYHGYLQLGIFKQQNNAKQYLAKLALKTQLPIAIKPVVKQGVEYYAIVMAGFDSKSAAQKTLAKLRSQGIKALLKPMGRRQHLYRMMPEPIIEQANVEMAQIQLKQSKQNPERLLTHYLQLPTSPEFTNHTPVALSIRDAILLSLRYSADLQGNELDRILMRYQLRIANNEFELQYAMSANNNFNWTRNEGLETYSQNWHAATSISKKSIWGGTAKASVNQSFDGSHYTPQAVFSLEQPLLRGAGPTVVTQNLMNQKDRDLISRLQLKQNYIDKITSVISAYRGLIQQQNILKTQLISLKEAKHTLWVNKKRISAGELEPTGNTQQAYQVATLTVTLASQKNRLLQAKRNLLQLIGLSPSLAFSVPNDVTVGPMTLPKRQETIAYGLKHNIAYQNALIQFKIVKRAYQVAQNDQLWSLNLSASQSYGAGGASAAAQNWASVSNGQHQGSNIGLRLEIPINDLNRRSTLISAKVSLEKARLNLLAQKRQLETDIINRLINIRTQISQYKMSQKQLALAQRSYDIELKKRKAGIASSLDVTNTQNQLINARNGVIDSKIAYLEGRSSLEQLLGTTLKVWRITLRGMDDL